MSDTYFTEEQARARVGQRVRLAAGGREIRPGAVGEVRHANPTPLGWQVGVKFGARVLWFSKAEFERDVESVAPGGDVDAE